MSAPLVAVGLTIGAFIGCLVRLSKGYGKGYPLVSLRNTSRVLNERANTR